MSKPFQDLGAVLMTKIPGAAARAPGALKPLYVVHFVIVCDSCDHMGRLKHFGSLFWACPRCLVTQKGQSDSSVTAKSRFDPVHLSLITGIYNALVGDDVAASKKAALELHALGLRDDIFPSFLHVTGHPYNIPWSWLMDYGKYSPSDILHGFPLGIFKHLQNTLFDFLSSAANRALEYNVNLLGAYFTDGVEVMDSFAAVNDFKTLSQIGGSGRESLMRLLLAALYPNVVSDPIIRGDIQWLFESALYIFSLIRGRPYKEDIDLLKVIIPQFMDTAKRVFPDHKSHWAFPKFHALLHLAELIIEWGSMSIFSMSFFGKFIRKRGERDSHFNHL
jgi:hypothetical protein